MGLASTTASRALVRMQITRQPPLLVRDYHGLGVAAGIVIALPFKEGKLTVMGQCLAPMPTLTLSKGSKGSNGKRKEGS